MALESISMMPNHKEHLLSMKDIGIETERMGKEN